MGRIAADLTGLTFGRLEVVSRAAAAGSAHAVWQCLCECGNTTLAIACNLKSGRTRSCGCGIGLANKARIGRQVAPRPKAKKPRGVVRLIAYDGCRQSLQDWARELGVNYQLIQYRLDKGWSVAKALTTPSRKSAA